MPDNVQKTGAGAPISSAVQAAVNAVPPGSVSLYDEQGKALSVQATDVDYWLQKGFRRAPHDLASLTEELSSLFDSAKRAVLEFADHAQKADALDGSENGLLRQAHVAMVELTTAFQNLHLSATVSKPIDNGAEPAYVEVNGIKMAVDPGQADGKGHWVYGDLFSETDPAKVPETLKHERARNALDELSVPDELRPAHLRSDPSKGGDLIP